MKPTKHIYWIPLVMVLIVVLFFLASYLTVTP
jgi:hypothetical protein